jgi:hypothetical protein
MSVQVSNESILEGESDETNQGAGTYSSCQGTEDTLCLLPRLDSRSKTEAQY